MTGRGRCCLRVWSDLCIATVINQAEKKRIVEVTRKMTRGPAEQAEQLLKASRGERTLNTAFIERLNGTMRERLAALTRKCRHAARRLEALETGMYLIGCTYNFCFAHHELSKAQQKGYVCTPAMAAGVTDHAWSIHEVLTYKIAPEPLSQAQATARTASQNIHCRTRYCLSVHEDALVNSLEHVHQLVEFYHLCSTVK